MKLQRKQNKEVKMFKKLVKVSFSVEVQGDKERLVKLGRSLTEYLNIKE